MWCAYKDALGVPRKGVHAARMMGDLALNDVVMTLMAPAIVLLPWIGSRHILRVYLLLLVWLITTGILLHRLFCVRTTLDKFLFPQ